MADNLDHLSTDELVKIAGGQSSSAPKPIARTKDGKIDFDNLSNDELVALASDGGGRADATNMNTTLGNVGSAIVKPVAAVGRFVDRFTGAPTRAAIGALQDHGGLVEAARAGLKQFGSDPELAPTGKQIAAKAGLSTDESIYGPFKDIYGFNTKVSPAGIAGLAVDVAADPTNLIPFGEAAKLGLKGLTKGAEVGLKGAALASDAITGTRLASGGLKTAADVAESAKLSMNKLFNPKIADDAAELTQIAEKNGISKDLLPSAVEFGPHSIITRGERVKAEGPLGEKVLKQHEEGLRAVRDATERKVAEIGGGPPLSKQEAGATIRHGYDSAVDKFFSTIEDSYGNVIKRNPGLGVAANEINKLNSAINGVEKFAKGRVSRGVTDVQRSQGIGLLNAVNAIRNTNGSFKQTVEALRDIGEAAFKSQNTIAAIPADVQKMRKLYGDVSEALINTVRQTEGIDAANAVLAENKRLHQFFGNQSLLENTIGNKSLSDEAVFRNLIENGDSKKIGALKAIIGSDSMARIKGSWLDSLLKRDLDQSFNFRPLVGTFRNKRTVMEALLEPNEISDVTDLVRLGDRFGLPIMSTSGTGASNIFRDIKHGVSSGILNDAFISGLKDRARGVNSAPLSEAKDIIQKPYSPIEARIQNIAKKYRELPKRSRLGNTAKTSQVISLQKQNSENDMNDAVARRINAMRNQ